MKYGDTLQQRSIPAWRAYNIDYDDIKHFIKENTTPGKGKSVSVPGRGDEKLAKLENDLYGILEEQHQRIDLFVSSKAGEVQRRLNHAESQLKQLARKHDNANDRRVPIKRLERYGRLESDVLKAGDEIRALARFSSTQRTAFRKLLKKFKKWTGSTALEQRFNEEVLDDPRSFTRLDLGPLLDDYSTTLKRIRRLYEAKLEQTRSPRLVGKHAATSELQQLQSALKTGSRVAFDTAIAAVPLGETGEIANYFVHLEAVVELQILLLQRMEYFKSRSRTNSTAPSASRADSTQGLPVSSPAPDYFMLIADDLNNFAHEQSALTVEEREHVAGLLPQKAKTFARWNDSEDALVTTRTARASTKSAEVKRKRIDALFETTPLSAKPNGVGFASDDPSFMDIRKEIAKNPNAQPLFKVSTCRSRFTGISSSSSSFSLATLDTSITIQKAGRDADKSTKSDFPFAVLQVRQEGNAAGDIISFLDRSHLVERVRGFSLEYHALWELYRPANIAPPFWLPILSRDIRKLPPPALDRAGSAGGSGSGSQTVTRHSVSTPSSALGITDTTTAVETERPSSNALPDLLESPPLESFKKKRRRTYAERSDRQQKYWSEYDNPEDGENGDGFFLYIDPNEKSMLDRLLDSISGFWRGGEVEQEPLLPPAQTPDEVESSDDEQVTVNPRSYGTTSHSTKTYNRGKHSSYDKDAQFLPPFTIICLVASIAILIVAYILKTTSKHKYATKVVAGVIFAIACSMVFAVVGFGPLLSRQNGSWSALVVAAVVLILDAIFSGYLLASMLG